MNRFLKKIFSLLLLFCVAMIGIFLLSGYMAKGKLLKKGRAVVIDKTKRLKELPSPKIVLVGGSNICYGINAKMLQDSLHIPVVDMSINASIGMFFYYEQVKQFLHASDIVIGIPEYAAYNKINIDGEESLYNLCVVQGENYKHLNARQWLSFPLYLGDVTRTNMKSLFESESSSNTNGRKLYDEYGSYSGHANKQSLSSKWAATEREENYKYASNQTINKAFVKLVTDFNDFCKSKNVTYLHSMPVYAKAYYDSSYMNSLVQLLKGIHVINKPEQYLYNMNEMYDTPNHLLYSFREARTTMLLHDIRKAMLAK